MISEVGRDLLLTRITRPHKAVAVGFGPNMFKEIDEGSLIVVDNVLLETLRYTVARAVEDGTFHRCGVVLLIDDEVLSSDALLTELNIRLRSLLAWTTVLLTQVFWSGNLLLHHPSNSHYCVSLRQLAVALTINGQGNHQLGRN